MSGIVETVRVGEPCAIETQLLCPFVHLLHEDRHAPTHVFGECDRRVGHVVAVQIR